MAGFTQARWPADGDVRAFLQYLSNLHRNAGRPSAKRIGDKVGLAPSTVHAFFTGDRLISVENLALLVPELNGEWVEAERLWRKAAAEWGDPHPPRNADMVASRPPPVGSAAPRPWFVPPVEREIVPRPELIDRLLATVCRDVTPGERTPTIAVFGSGGYGKTTLVAELCRRAEVQAALPGGLLWVKVGRAAKGAKLADKVNDLVEQITGRRPLLADPQQAGYRLGDALDTHFGRLMLVVDDVWTDEQMAPFLVGGKDCPRLFTTRNKRLLLPGDAVHVDQMSVDEAAKLLTRGLVGIEAPMVDELVTLTAGWAVLLDLTNRALHRATRVDAAADPSAVAHRIAKRLRAIGPTALDGLNETDDDNRHEAVGATVGVGLGLLPSDIHERYLELGVFPEDVEIPCAVLELLWGAEGLNRFEVERVCEDLFDLSMVVAFRHDPPSVRLHGVLRAYLRHLAGREKVLSITEKLLAAAARLVEPDPSDPPAHNDRAAWWRLPAEGAYLRSHLVGHLSDAGRHRELTDLAQDLRWAVMRIGSNGPAAFESDLEHVDNPTAGTLRRAIVQCAHLLGPIEPDHSLGAILVSRLSGRPDLEPLVQAYSAGLQPPKLSNRWSLPDQPHPAQRRTLIGHLGAVTGIAITPDGSRIATIGDDRTLRIWSPTGIEMTKAGGHAARLTGLAIAPDGTWLATVGDDQAVRTWHADTGRETDSPIAGVGTTSAVAISPDGDWLVAGGSNTADGNVHILDLRRRTRTTSLTGHAGWTYAVAISPEATWLVTGGADGAARIWDRRTGNPTATLTGHTGRVNAVAIAPDGTWLATAGADGTTRIWDRRTGHETTTLTGHSGAVNGLAIAPDGTWLATAGADGTTRIWDRRTGHETTTLTGHSGAVNGLAIAPDGTWLATAGDDQSVRIWDAGVGRGSVSAGDNSSPINAVAVAPDGTWLVTGGDDRTLRIWHIDGGNRRATDDRHDAPIRAVAIAPHAGWFATASADRTVRLWNAADGAPGPVLSGHTGAVNGVAVSPDGSWLATVGNDGSVRIWDSTTGEVRMVLIGHSDWIFSVAISPDATWLATAGADRTVRTWDAEAGTAKAVLSGHTAAVNTVAISPDGTWLATASADRTVRTWDSGSGVMRSVHRGHTAAVNAVAIDPDGVRLATASTDQTLRIWNVTDERPIAAMRVDGRLHSCVWHPHGSDVVTVGQAGSYSFHLHIP